MAKIKLNVGIPDAIANALGLRQGRPQFDQALMLDSNVVPVVVLSSVQSVSGAASVNPTSDVDSARVFSGQGIAISNPGTFSAVQLKNPAGSGRVLYVDAVDFLCGTANDRVSDLKFYDTDLATLAGSPVNHYSGASGGTVAQIRTQNTLGAPVGTLITSAYISQTVAATRGDWDRFLRDGRSLRLDAGKGVLVHAQAAATSLVVNFTCRDFPA